MSRRNAVVGALAAVSLCAPVFLHGPASAKVVDAAVIHEEYSFTSDGWCGDDSVDVLVSGTFDVKYTAVQHGPKGLVHFRAKEVVNETHTYNGVTTRFLLTSPSRDLKVVDNGDGTLTITVLATGNAVLYGPTGKAIARDPGQIRFRFDVDHGGTPTDPSDDEEIEGSFEIIKSSTGRSDDFCEAEMALFT
jgi:hypothetical protein